MNFSVEYSKRTAIEGDVDAFLASTACLEQKEQRKVAILRTTRDIYKSSEGSCVFGPEDNGDILRAAFEEAQAIDRGEGNEAIARASATRPVRLLADDLKCNLEVGGENDYDIQSSVNDFYVAAYELKCMFRKKNNVSS